jgi:serine/threonine-protein kinase
MGADAGPNDELQAGDLLAKRYKITDFLGHGGMGLVYAALDVKTATPVAIKLPRSEMRSKKKALARFGRESRAAAKLRGPHVVRVTDVAELADGTPFIVMELLVGRDLATELDERGALPVREAVSYVLQAASGVAEAHANGIVHRDLKPHNLFLVNEPAGRTVKVLDFGISKMGDGEIARMTTTNARLGTPLYVSPEQLVSAKYVDARSDVWSLGVILYELLTGALPFGGATAIAVAAAIQTEEPKPPSAHVPTLPKELEGVVRKALAKKAEQRFQNVTELAEALLPFGDRTAFAGSVAPAARKPTRRATPAPLPAGDTHPDSARESDTPVGAESPREEGSGGRESPGGRARSMALVVLAAVVGLGLLALALLNH